MTTQELNVLAEAIKFHSKPLYTTKETAEILQTTVARVSELMNKGILVYLKLGDRKVTRKHLYEFIEKHDGQDVNQILEERG